MSSVLYARFRVNFFFVVALIILSSASVANPLFDEPSFVFDLDVPKLCETADFNDDGNMDIVVLESYTNHINIFWGYGDGTFSHSQFFSNFIVGCMSICNLNADIYPDLVVGESPGEIRVFLGNGAGGFEAGQAITHDHFSVNTGDLNGDGYSDLLLPYHVASHYWIDVFLCDGEGSFSLGSSYEIENNGITQLLFVPGDLDGDGINDVAFVPFGSYRLGILLGNGDGTLQPEYYNGSSYGICGYWSTIAEGDFNEDGSLDLVATSGNAQEPEDLVLVNDGYGNFSTSDSLGNVMAWAIARDFDLDGHLDLAGSLAYIKIYKGFGDGTFGEALYSNYPAYNQLGVADFDNDGDQDIVRLSDSVFVYLNNTIQLGIDDTPSDVLGTSTTLTNSENPISGSAEVILNLPVSSHCLVSIFDFHGREVETIQDGNLGVGEHVLPWDSEELPQGCYTVMLSTEFDRVCSRFVKVD